MDMWSEQKGLEQKGSERNKVAPKPAVNKVNKTLVGESSGKLAVNGRDRVTVTDEALATLIGLAAHEVPGVVGMAPATIREGLKRILGVRQADEGVVVSRLEGQETAANSLRDRPLCGRRLRRQHPGGRRERARARSVRGPGLRGRGGSPGDGACGGGEPWLT